MSVGNVAVGCDSKSHVVAHDVIQSHFLGQDPRRVLRNSIQHLSDLAISYSQNRLTIAPPVFVASGSVVMRIPVGTDFYPIDGKPLRIMDVAVDRDNGAAVVRIVPGPVPREPYAAFKRRAENHSRLLPHRH